MGQLRVFLLDVLGHMRLGVEMIDAPVFTTTPFAGFFFKNITLLASLFTPTARLLRSYLVRNSKLESPRNKSAQADPGDVPVSQILISTMPSPEDVNFDVMAEVAKNFLGPTVVGTFFNICLVSEHISIMTQSLN